MHPAKGKEAEVLATLKGWQEDLAHQLGQPIKAIVYRANDTEDALQGQGELVVAIAFSDENTFTAAMSGRTTNPLFSQLVAALSEEPLFLDGPVLWSSFS